MTIEIAPKSFKEYAKPLTRTNQIMLDASDHNSEHYLGQLYYNPHPVSYYRNCQDPVRFISRTPRNLIDWSSIYYIDYKLTKHSALDQKQDLQRILANDQPLHVLHLVYDHVPVCQVVDFIESLHIVNDIVLDLHSIRAYEPMQIQFDHLNKMQLSRFLTVDFHYIINDQEAVYMHLSGVQRLEFYNPHANRGSDAAIAYAHMLRK
jgi:hypothetical protein